MHRDTTGKLQDCYSKASTLTPSRSHEIGAGGFHNALAFVEGKASSTLTAGHTGQATTHLAQGGCVVTGLQAWRAAVVKYHGLGAVDACDKNKPKWS